MTIVIRRCYKLPVPVFDPERNAIVTGQINSDISLAAICMEIAIFPPRRMYYGKPRQLDLFWRVADSVFGLVYGVRWSRLGSMRANRRH